MTTTETTSISAEQRKELESLARMFARRCECGSRDRITYVDRTGAYWSPLAECQARMSERVLAESAEYRALFAYRIRLRPKALLIAMAEQVEGAVRQ